MGTMAELIQLQTAFDPLKANTLQAAMLLCERIRLEEVVHWKAAAKENQVAVLIPRLIEPVIRLGEQGQKKLAVRTFVLNAQYEQDGPRELLHFLP